MSTDDVVLPSDVEDILREQEQAWRDATDDSLDAVYVQMMTFTQM